MARNKDLFFSFVTVTVEALKSRGVTDAVAQSATREAVERLMRSMGGLVIYIPNGHRDRVEQRAKSVLDEFNGTNQKELAAKYGISQPHVSRLVRKGRALLKTDT